MSFLLVGQSCTTRRTRQHRVGNPALQPTHWQGRRRDRRPPKGSGRSRVFAHRSGEDDDEDEDTIYSGSHLSWMSRPEFAFLIEKLSTRAEVVHFIAKWRITVFFL